MILLGVLVLLSPACVKLGKTDLSSFYVLNSSVDSSSVSSASSASATPVVGVRPVVLPKILDRPHFVIRKSTNEIEIVQTQRWGEPLEDGIERVLVENLVSMVPTKSVFTLPSRTQREFDIQVELEIFHYGYSGDGSVLLSARWTLNHGEEDEILAEKTTDIHEPVPSPDGTDHIDYYEVAAAMSRALARLSQEIAGEIRSRSS